jgi:hypothetical protein
MNTQLLFNFKLVYNVMNINDQSVNFYLSSGAYLGSMCLKYNCASYARGIKDADYLMDVAINNLLDGYL